MSINHINCAKKTVFSVIVNKKA